MAPKTSSLKRDKIRMQRVMPRTGAQIKELQFSCQRKELLEWVDAHQHMLPTLVFVCKSGMLEEMEAVLRKEHWLPPSNVYFHNVARAFFGFALSSMCEDLTPDLLQVLTTNDADAIWKLLYMSTHTHRNSKVPTLHKLSFVKLLQDRHSELGLTLNKIDWKKVNHTGRIDFDKYGLFSTVRDEGGNITGLKYNGNGESYSFPRLIPKRMVLSDNWCLPDARLVDPDDEEDPVKLVRRFKALSKELVFSTEAVATAEETCNADAVRLKKEEDSDGDGSADDSSKARSSKSTMAPPVEPPSAKKAKTTVKKEGVVPAAPTITPIKATRRPRGHVKAE